MNDLKHLFLLISEHEMRAIFNFEKLAATRCKLLVLPDDLLSTLRSEKVIVTKCMSYWKVDLWIAKTVPCRHRVPHKEGKLEGHYFYNF